MATGSYQAPKIRSIIIGIVLTVILLGFFCNLSQAVKFAGAALMVLPDSLGTVRQVKSDEVQTLFLKNSPTLIVTSNPGRFQIFTDDYDLLTITMQLSDKDAKPWLNITDQISGAQLPVEYILRGLRPYDTPLAKGRPIFAFTLPGPGRYEIVHPERDASISIVPDYSTGNEGSITLWFLLQGGLIALVLAAIYGRQQRKKMKAIREIKELGNRRRGGDFWKTQTEKHQERDNF
jgi:hypothetical protein